MSEIKNFYHINIDNWIWKSIKRTMDVRVGKKGQIAIPKKLED